MTASPDPEDRLLLASAKQHLHEADQAAILALGGGKLVRWNVVFAKADQHAVAPLVFANLSRCLDLGERVPPEVLRQFRLRFAANLAFKQRLGEAVARFLEYLTARGLEAMLVKSSALDALIYGARPYTTCQDADVVLRCRRSELGADGVRALTDFAHGRALEFDFHEHHDLTLNGVIGVDFDAIWQDAQPLEFQGQPAWVMSPEDLFIAACVNSCRKRFVQLKALCDIVAIVDHYPDLRWEVVCRKAKAYGCDSLIYTAVRLAQQTIGCGLTRARLSDLAVAPARAALMEALSRYVARQPIVGASAGPRVLRRPMTLSLMLPYAVYSSGQLWRKARFLWSSRPAR